MSDQFSQYNAFKIAHSAGLKITFKRHRCEPTSNDLSPPSVSSPDQPAKKRQRMAAILHADLPSSFRPTLASTCNSQDLEQQFGNLVNTSLLPDSPDSVSQSMDQ